MVKKTNGNGLMTTGGNATTKHHNCTEEAFGDYYLIESLRPGLRLLLFHPSCITFNNRKYLYK